MPSHTPPSEHSKDMRTQNTELNPELIAAVKTLIDAGSHYHIEALAECYSSDLQILMVQENNELQRFDYEQNLAFFRQLKASNAPPLSTHADFLYASIDSFGCQNQPNNALDKGSESQDTGYVIVSRKMNLGAGEKRIVFTLMLRQEGSRWRVFREHAVFSEYNKQLSE